MFEDLRNLVHGVLGGLVSDLERQNPEAALDIARDNLEKQVAQYDQGIASHAGLCDRLMTQVKRLEAEQQDLRAKAGAHLQAGSRDIAGQYAVRLETVERELQDNRSQLEQAQNIYKELLKARDIAVDGARARITALHNAIRDTKMKDAAARLKETAVSLSGPPEGSGDMLSRLESMVDEQKTTVAGRNRMAGDALDTSGVNLKDSGQDQAERALADFAAREGIALAPRGSGTDADVPVKSMGNAAAKEN